MIRSLLLTTFCALATSAAANEILVFPPAPNVGNVVNLVVDAEVPTDATFQWKSRKPGESILSAISQPTRSLDLPTQVAGTWLVEAAVSYKNPQNQDVTRVFRVTFEVSTPVPTESPAPTPVPPSPSTKLTTGERRKQDTEAEALKAKQKASELATAAQVALDKAKASGDPKDFADAAAATKAATEAQEAAANKVKAETNAANDTFKLRDTIVAMLTTRQAQSPGNTDSEFFTHASAMSTIFQKAIEAGNAAKGSNDTTSNVKAVHKAILDALEAGVNADFPESSNQLRIKVWRTFFQNTLTTVQNTIGRSEHWKRLETPSNLILLYSEVQLAIDEAIRAEHEFTANYETLQNYNNSNGGTNRSRSRKSFLKCLLSL